jgi:predicted acylesterase/phospholipase RssA/CRP-like cAMP-binding protein
VPSDRDLARTRALARVPLFQGLEPALLGVLDRECERVTLPGGACLFRQGDAADALYVVLSGRLEVVSEPEGGTRVLVGELGRDACVGEMSLLTGEPRSATVRAIRDSELLRIDSARFAQFLGTYPQLGAEIARTLARRLAATTAAAGAVRDERVATIAIVPALAEDLPEGFVPALIECFASSGRPARRLSRALVEAQLWRGACEVGVGDPVGEAMVQWLAEQEEAADYVVYEADGRHGAWTDRCLRQADHLLLVARAGADPARVAPELWEKLQSATHASMRKDVVLVHEGDAAPNGSSAWRRGRPVGGVHHVRLSRPQDHERLVRKLTRRSLGLVLSGGGARGFAHIGVIKACRELDVPIDVVGGTSMGSILAAQAALEWTPEEMVERTRAGFATMAGVRAVRDVTFPLVSLLTSRVTVRMLRGMFGERDIDDLWLSYFCVSANLSRAQAVIHDTGSLWFWVKASCAVPGIQAPSFHEGDVYVDGGLLNNLPADVMRRRNAGTVLAVDVNPPLEFTAPPAPRASLSGPEALMARLRRSGNLSRLPSIFGLLSRSVGLSSLQNRTRIGEFADLSLYPPLQDVDPFDWRAVAETAERGYRYALPRIAAWKAAQ